MNNPLVLLFSGAMHLAFPLQSGDVPQAEFLEVKFLWTGVSGPKTGDICEESEIMFQRQLGLV